MPNEFVIKNGFISKGNSIVNGGITATTISASTISAPGSNTQVIYNNGGVLGADTGFVYSGGSIGIVTTSPSTKLDVSGKTKTINLQITSGATIGYVLTSDASGNATWQIPPVGIHAARIPASGGFINSLMMEYQGLTLLTLAANGLRCWPFIPMKSFSIVSYSIEVTTAVAASNMRVLFYDDLNGLPNAKLYESANIDSSTLGVKTVTQAYTFNAGTIYWLCVQTSAAVQIRSHTATGGGFAWQQSAASTQLVNSVGYIYALGSAPATLTTTGAGYVTVGIPHLIFNL